MTDQSEVGAPNPTGFTAMTKELCEETCGQFGEPACWKLPDMVHPCEQITPCADCLKAERDALREEVERLKNLLISRRMNDANPCEDFEDAAAEKDDWNKSVDAALKGER